MKLSIMQTSSSHPGAQQGAGSSARNPANSNYMLPTGSHTYWTPIVQPPSRQQHTQLAQHAPQQTPETAFQSPRDVHNTKQTVSPAVDDPRVAELIPPREYEANRHQYSQPNRSTFVPNKPPTMCTGTPETSQAQQLPSSYRDSPFGAWNLPPPPSSPLSSVASPAGEDTSFEGTFSLGVSTSASSLKSPATSPVPPSSHDSFQVEYDRDAPEGQREHGIFRLKPTAAQWDDFPAILSFARSIGAARDGCFKVKLPPDLQGSLPQKPPQTVTGNAYKIRQIKRNGFWQVHTVSSEGRFESPNPSPQPAEDVNTVIQRLKKLFNKNKDKQIRSIRYRVDVPAWTLTQRAGAGVPANSPIHPLKGDKLDDTKAVIPGIHTPYVYEANDHFGATFQIHAEDYRLVSLNHLYKGRKIWIVVPSTEVDIAEEAFGRKKKCSQFMRHRAEFFFPDKLEKMKIPYRIIDQRPGETIVILPDAYHEGFSTGYTLAEAKNYAETTWSTDTYQPCDASCQLMTAIPDVFMKPLKEGEVRLDLCAGYGGGNTSEPPKRSLEDAGENLMCEEDNAKRVKV